MRDLCQSQAGPECLKLNGRLVLRCHVGAHVLRLLSVGHRRQTPRARCMPYISSWHLSCSGSGAIMDNRPFVRLPYEAGQNTIIEACFSASSPSTETGEGAWHKLRTFKRQKQPLFPADGNFMLDRIGSSCAPPALQHRGEMSHGDETAASSLCMFMQGSETIRHKGHSTCTTHFHGLKARSKHLVKVSTAAQLGQ